MILWKLKLFLFLDHKFYAFPIPPKIIRLLAVSLFSVREQMWIKKKNAFSQIALGQVEKRHILFFLFGLMPSFLAAWSFTVCCL